MIIREFNLRGTKVSLHLDETRPDGVGDIYVDGNPLFVFGSRIEALLECLQSEIVDIDQIW